jgi:DNA-binding transcriptional ArsR family regulator
VSEETRWEVAQVVGLGHDTSLAVARALKTTKTTASHALRHLTDEGYVERHRYEGGAVIYSYTLVKMPPAPKRKRSHTLAAAQPAFARDPVHSTDALDACLPMPPLPQGQLAVVHRLGTD